jgi:hypothetical protein
LFKGGHNGQFSEASNAVFKGMLPSKEDVSAFGHMLFGNQLLIPSIRPISIQPRTPPVVVKQQKTPVSSPVVSSKSPLLASSVIPAEVITVDDRELMPPPSPISPEPIDNQELVNPKALPVDLAKAFAVVDNESPIPNSSIPPMIDNEIAVKEQDGISVKQVGDTPDIASANNSTDTNSSHPPKDDDPIKITANDSVEPESPQIDTSTELQVTPNTNSKDGLLNTYNNHSSSEHPTDS